MKPRPPTLSLRTLVLVVALAAPGLAQVSPARPSKLVRAEASYRALLAKHGLASPPGAVKVLVYKARRRLELWAGGKLILGTRCALGGAPLGNKVREGDLKTPEGEYYVCTRNDRSRFHLFLGLSYPGRSDADRGLKDKLITKPQHQRILEAVRRKAPVPWNTSLGGAIGLHGNGSAYDWTLGCIAVEDEEIEALWEFCRSGTPVVIFP